MKRRRIPIVETCIECGQRAMPGYALCKKCYGQRKLRQELARPFPAIELNREERRQAEEAQAFDSSVLVRQVCPHGFKDWTECPACVAAADYDDGGDA